ncbi:LysR family transcriptional regulator [Magnetofaba australis]|uniref:Putative LysR family transcriptional regulator n=1 Tax=Magnetofaba australis IT-1 TaxID=1434232 RepID=A0A1Y2K5T2_9PROT|nr:LysR family transcriptional regulator [Magnetofaba australis]OSM04979.1 putative LysR family transcriptional regulator [Magnetofaba australis IT-1]
MDRFRALEVFVAVAEAGSLIGAAKALSISAPSVTRILGELESDLDVLLFHRSTRATTLTDPGRAFLTDARRILDDFHISRDAARGAHRAPKGVLRLTAPTLFGQLYVSPVLLGFLDRYPEMEAEAIYLDRIVNLIDEGFDLAVRIGALPETNLMAIRVGAVRRVLCAAEAYLSHAGIPQTLEALAEHRIIAARPVASTNAWRFAGGESVRVTPRVSFSTIPAAIDAAKSGWGVTQALSYQIGPEVDAGSLKIVLGDYEPEPMPVHIVHPEGRHVSAKVRAFIDMAVESLRANPLLKI